MHAALAAMLFASAPAWGRLDVNAGGSLALWPDHSGSTVDLGVGGVLYRGDLVDDAEPMAFQSLVQEVSTLSVGGSYARLSTDTLHGDDVAAKLSGTLFFDEAEAVSGTLSTEVFDEDTPAGVARIVAPELWVSVGGATPRRRIWVGAHFAELYVNGQHVPRVAAMLVVSGGALIADRVWLGGELQSLSAGGRASADIDVAPTHGSELELTGFADHGQLYINTNAEYLRVGGTLLAGAWLSDEVRLGLSYALSSAREVEGDFYGDATVTHSVQLSFAMCFH